MTIDKMHWGLVALLSLFILVFGTVLSEWVLDFLAYRSQLPTG